MSRQKIMNETFHSFFLMAQDAYETKRPILQKIILKGTNIRTGVYLLDEKENCGVLIELNSDSTSLMSNGSLIYTGSINTDVNLTKLVEMYETGILAQRELDSETFYRIIEMLVEFAYNVWYCRK